MRTRSKFPWLVTVVAGMMAIGVPPAGSSVLHRNAAQLTHLAKDIVVARIVSVSDGLTDQNVPFTEVAITIDRTVKGDKSGGYIFRQFGLLEPRPIDDGLMNLNVTPEGWPRYRVGENVMLFLYNEAAMTGLRTTVGLFQGKFTIEGGAIVNGAMNQGLFSGVSVPKAQLSDAERALLTSPLGPVSADALPGAGEEYFNGAGESNIGMGPMEDLVCSSTTITAVAGSPATADIMLNDPTLPVELFRFEISNHRGAASSAELTGEEDSEALKK